MRATDFTIVLALAAIIAASAADARPRRHSAAPSGGFLELLQPARVAKKEGYIAEATTLHRPIYSTFAPDSFGDSVLPGRFGQIGR